MIQRAVRNAPGTELVVQDARKPLPSRGLLGGVLDVDSLNRLMNLEKLTQVFANVREALAEGEYFAFDPNMATARKTRWHQTFVYVEDDHMRGPPVDGSAAMRRPHVHCSPAAMGTETWRASVR